MSQLYTLMNSLDDAELSRIKEMRLIGKERSVFDHMLQLRGRELPTIDIILKAVSVTDTHFYKINSVLLRKCYEVLVEEGGITLLHYLKRKGLFPLLRHEMLAQDKLWSKKEKNTDKEKFYLACFHLLIDFPYKFYDKKLCDAFGEKYLEAKKADASDKLYVKYHKLFADSNRLAAQKNPGKAFGVGPAELKEHEEQLKGTKHYLAQYYLYRTFCSYYTYYESNPARVLEYLQKAIALKDKISDFFPVNIGQFLRFLYADALFTNNRTAEAYKLYKEVFDEDVDEGMYGYHYHCEQYALSAITQQEYDKAAEMLDSVFKASIESRNDIYATRGALTYAKLFLSSGEYRNALSYINIAREINEKTFYLPFDVQLRLLENMLFFFKGDYDFSHQLAGRNIKFAKSQGTTELLNDYLILWKSIIAMVNSIDRGTPFPKNLEEDYERISNRYVNLYCNLPRMLRAKTAEAMKQETY
jgi:hypothetical protein